MAKARILAAQLLRKIRRPAALPALIDSLADQDEYVVLNSMLAVPSVMALITLAFVLGVGTWLQVSSARKAVEVLHAHRMLDLAASSALEDAAAQIENSMPPVPYPPRRRLRNPDLSTLTYPSRVQPATAARELASENIRLGEVAVQWSGIRRREAGDGAREYGVIQMEAPVSIQTRFGGLRRTVRVRRYVNLEPNAADGALRFRIHPGNLIHELKER